MVDPVLQEYMRVTKHSFKTHPQFRQSPNTRGGCQVTELKSINAGQSGEEAMTSRYIGKAEPDLDVPFRSGFTR